MSMNVDITNADGDLVISEEFIDNKDLKFNGRG